MSHNYRIERQLPSESGDLGMRSVYSMTCAVGAWPRAIAMASTVIFRLESSNNISTGPLLLLLLVEFYLRQTQEHC